MHPDKIGNQPPTRGALAVVPEAPPESNGIVWEDPPGARTGRNGIDTIIAPLVIELRRNPGKWARLKTFDRKQGASSAKNGLGKRGTYPDIEFVGRSLPDGTSALYGRYVGAE